MSLRSSTASRSVGGEADVAAASPESVAVLGRDRPHERDRDSAHPVLQVPLAHPVEEVGSPMPRGLRLVPATRDVPGRDGDMEPRVSQSRMQYRRIYELTDGSQIQVAQAGDERPEVRLRTNPQLEWGEPLRLVGEEVVRQVRRVFGLEVVGEGPLPTADGSAD